MILERGALLIGRYRIVEILGQGGMGSIYRAIDENLGVEVAVKDNLFTTDDYARQFRREAVILANLRHPNLPRVTDHFVIEQQGQYLVMDYIEGEDLRQRMDRVGNLSEQDVITVGSAICDAMHYLHTRNPAIIHRDIKPGNIKITSQGQIFLVDFGLAKVIMGSQATTTGARAMTPGYSPPEQYGTARTDGRSDIFSLGATLYAALTGAIPEDSMARMMGQAELTPIRRLNPQVTRRLATTIEKSLDVQPANRYQTALEFKSALRNALSTSKRRVGVYHIEPAPDAYDRPIPAEESLPPLPSQAAFPRSPDRSGLDYPAPISPGAFNPSYASGGLVRKGKGKNWLRGRWLVFGLVALLLAAALLVSMYDPRLPALAFARFLPSSAAAFIPAPSETPTASATLPEEAETAASMVILQEASSTPTPTEGSAPPQPEDATATPSPSPTTPPTPLPTLQGGGGGQIAFASKSTGSNQIYVANLDGSSLRQITDIKGGACQPSWSPDGARLVFISPCDSNHELYPGSSLFIVNYDGSGLISLKTIPGGDFDPAWSPDGRHIAFTSLRSSGRPQIYLYDLQGDSARLLSEKYAREMQPSWSADGKEIIYISASGGVTQIWKMDADGSNPAPVSTMNNWSNMNPSLSPDGKLILFTQLVAPRGIPRIVVAALEGGYTEYRVDNQEKLAMREASYSPDGSMMVVEGWGAGSDHNIYILVASGAIAEQVTNSGRINFDPAWRPAAP